MDRPEVSRIVADLLSRPEEERARAAESICGADAELLAQVRQMLGRTQRMGRVLGIGDIAAADAAEPEPEHSVPAGGRPLRPWLLPGEYIGAYEILSFHAGGGSSEVYRVRRRDGTGAVLALKVVRADAAPATRARFLRESRIAREIAHPHLARILDSGEDRERGLLFHAMSLVRGPSLEAVLERLAAAAGPPTSAGRRALALRMREAAAALAALHARGIVHRDIKPLNLVLDGPPDVGDLDHPLVVVDLGLARELELHLEVSTLQITYPYVAPEVMLGWPATPASDVFSLGVTFHDLLCGRQPRQRGRPHTTGLEPLAAVIPNLDPDLAAILDDACALDARLRYPDAGALERDLARWLAGRPVRARPTRGIDRIRRMWRRQPRRVLRGIVAVAAVALLLGLVGMGGVRVADALASCRDANAAFGSGDLASCLQAVARSPSWSHLLLERPLRTALAEPGSDAMARVLEALDGRGVTAACRLAAAFLDRDGHATHPRLVRFLATELASGDARTLTERRAAFELVGSLCFTREAVGAADLAALAPLRRRLLDEIAGAAADPLCAMAAAGALAGCGTAADLPALLSYGEQCARAGGSENAEAVRLVLASLARLLQRLPEAAAPPPSWGELQAVVGAAERWTAAVADGAADAGFLWGGLDHLRVAVVCLWRRGAVPGSVPDLPGTRERSIAEQAARSEPAFVGELAAVDDWHPGCGPADRVTASGVELGHCELAGYLAGLVSDPTCTAAVRGRIIGLAQRHRLDPGWCGRVFEAGLTRGDCERRGLRQPALVDDGARLACLLTAPGDPLPLRIRSIPAHPDEPLCAVQLRTDPPTASGSATRVAVRDALWLADRTHSDEHMVCLGVPGRSELRLHFDIPVRRDQGVVLELELQRSWRETLPFGGRTGLVVGLDGATRIVIPEIDVVSGRRLVVPLGRCDDVGHELTLRLSPDSTGTLWLYGLAVR